MVALLSKVASLAGCVDSSKANVDVEDWGRYTLEVKRDVVTLASRWCPEHRGVTSHIGGVIEQNAV